MPRVTVWETSQGMQPVVEAILAAHPLEWAGKSVLVKPNLLGRYPPEKGVTTSPELVEAVVTSLQSRGARVAVGDNPGVDGYALSGSEVMKATLGPEARACAVNLGAESRVVRLPGAPLEAIPISTAVLDSDLVVSLPRAKTHVLSLVTGGIKNTFGYVAGAAKATIHARLKEPTEFSRFLVELYRIRPPDLTIMDALTVMEGGGPSGGDLREYGRLLASEDGAAVDEVLLGIMGVEPGSIAQIQAARAHGLGSGAGPLEVVGEAPVIPRFKLPDTYGSRLGARLGNRVIFPVLQPIPRIDRHSCTGCGICWEHCPVKVIREGRPAEIDRDGCIRCYCCVELCPEGAARIRGSFLDRLRRVRRFLRR